MINKPCIALLLVGVLGLVALGCGDDTTADSNGESSLSKAEFVKRANLICDRGRTRMLESEDLGGPGLSEAETVALTVRKAWLPKLQEVIDQIRDLGAPPGDEAEVEALLDAMQEAVDAGAQSDIPTLGRFEGIFASSGSLADKYGASSCSYG